MKILTNKKLDNLLRNEYAKGFDDGKQYVYKHYNKKNDWNDGFKAGKNQTIEDVRFDFEKANTPEEFCKMICQKYF